MGRFDIPAMSFAAGARLAFLAIITSCGSLQQAPVATLSYAIGTHDYALGGPFGRLEIIDQQIDADFSSVRVCIQTPRSGLSRDHFILEAKLAHALWLAEAGYDHTAFEKFQFYSQDKCARDDARFATVLAIADFRNEAPGDDYKDLFMEPRIFCRKNGSNKTCGGPPLSLGRGGPGTLKRFVYPRDPQKWSRVESKAPSGVLLSPYIEWLALEELLEESAEVSQSSRQKLLRSLHKLRKQSSVSYTDLSAFGKALAEAKVLAGPEPVFALRQKRFKISDETHVDEVIKPRLSVFRTLLHEVGHTYGLHHPDNPSAGCVTGPSSSTRWDESRGRYITSESAMAYGDLYLYLTEDDVKGIQAQSRQIKKFVSQHL